MTDALFSPTWFRVANLKPRLHSHIELHRHEYRGEAWYIYQNRASGRTHRFNSAAHRLIARMDGNRSIQQIWEAAGNQSGLEAPTPTEVVDLLRALYVADMVHLGVAVNLQELAGRAQAAQPSALLTRLTNPLALRIPLVDPDRFLNHTQQLVRWAFTPWGLWVWALTIGLALVLSIVHWPELRATFAGQALQPHNLLLMAALYPLVKLCHELGHAYATKIWGGDVHVMGVVVLLLLPVPFVDASAASSFRSRRRRMGVGAAGIMVELFLSALALFVWLLVEPGIISAIAFNVMLIGSISTVLFNGNPLLRYDGYYVLADAVGIPNLASRANRYLGYLAQRYVLGLDGVASPVTSRGERAWFVFYGLSSFSYRVVVLALISLWLIQELFFAGVILAVWALTSQIVEPLLRHASLLANHPGVRQHRLRAWSGVAGASLAVLLVLFAIPVPLGTVAEGVVWVPDNAVVRAGAEGFVRKVYAHSNDNVVAGQALLLLDDPLVAAERNALQGKLRELRAQHTRARVQDRVRTALLDEEIAQFTARLDRLDERIGGLTVRSRVNGKLVLPSHDDLRGQFLRQGDLVGYVVPDGHLSARAVLPQQDIGLFERLRGVEVRLHGSAEHVLAAELERLTPAADMRLPSAALGTQGGGSVVTDPSDLAGLKTLQPLFHIDVSLPDETPAAYLGRRVYVRFDHGNEAIAWRLARSLRQLFLRQLDV
ncbi:MAG: hypothetical protein AMJ69_09200 [Gammaproteobacteria bacterium SG8_47]|nr:MAG: hypothetical protein AMJ69_09200 [Gammaproteobacteria bacterium SG8_47]